MTTGRINQVAIVVEQFCRYKHNQMLAVTNCSPPRLSIFSKKIQKQWTTSKIRFFQSSQIANKRWFVYAIIQHTIWQLNEQYCKSMSNYQCPVLSMPLFFRFSLRVSHSDAHICTTMFSYETSSQTEIESVTNSFFAKSWQSSICGRTSCCDLDHKVFRYCF